MEVLRRQPAPQLHLEDAECDPPDEASILGRADHAAVHGALHDAADQTDDALARRLEADRTSRWLFRSALKQMSGRSVAAEPTAQRFGTLAIHLTQFGLLPGLGFKLVEGRRQFDAIRHGYG